MKKTSNIDINTFLNPNKYAAYALGVIWGDGNIENNPGRKRISIHCITEDALHFYSMFQKIGQWNINHNKQQKHWKPQSTIRASSKEVVDLLVLLDYAPNTKTSANKVLNIIPKELHKYFFLGLIDADGCFYIHQKNNTYHFILSGPYEQDWSFFTDTLKELSIEYREERRILKENSKYSQIRIIGKKRIELFGKWLYSEPENIGLPRKYEKYKLISAYKKHGMTKLNKEDIIFIRENYKNNYTAIELSKMFNVCPASIYNIINKIVWKDI